MPLPRKIDDRLKDAIVNVQFTPAVPPETVVGYVHSLIKDHLASIPTQQGPWVQLGSTNLSVDVRSFYFLTTDQKFRVDVSEQGITFNLVNGYAGWTSYRQVIETCLKPLYDAGIIKHVLRLGVRYISQFDQIRIFDCINAIVRIDIAPANNWGQVRVEFEQNGLRAVLTLVDSYPAGTSAPSVSEGSYFSLIDLDVIKFFTPNQPIPYQQLLQELETAHNEEKRLFFSLLKEDFLLTLNPVY